MSALRTPTQQEAQEFQNFCDANNIVKDENSATRLGEPILIIGQQINQSTLKAAFEMVKGQLTYLPVKSAAQLQYEQAVRDGRFSQDQLDAFDAWYAQQRLVQGERDEAFENKSALLRQLQGRPVNRQTVAEALGRIFNNSTHRMHLLPEPLADSFGRHTNTKFDVQDSVTLSVDGDQKWDSESKFAAGGRINHAHNPKLQPTKPAAPTQNHWQQRAEALQGDRASETDQLRRIFVTGSGLKMTAFSSQVDWKQTFEAREAAYKQIVRARERSQ